VTCADRPAQGFTLLEMLVVLALVAMVAAVAVPQAARWLEAAEERGWRDDLKARIERLPVRAFHSGEPLDIDERALVQGLPGRSGGLTLKLSGPLRYTAAGIASGATVDLMRGGELAYRWRVEPVTGRVLEDRF
jgi:prepilin-type N-terminal cleavage/methylation domain-containing protein